VIAVGIDPSLTCSGVAIIDGNGAVITRRHKTAPAGKSLKARRGRLRDAVAGILKTVPAHVDVSVIEVPAFGRQFGALGERVALYWWLVDQLMARGPVVEVSPSQRAKLATGNGASKKPEVVAAMRDRFPSVWVPDDNVADALALAQAGAHWLSPDSFPLTPAQSVAFARLDWA
jgi:Holliday junction resolvasome RuvABC endonuclease subunit